MLTQLINALIPIIIIAAAVVLTVAAMWVKFYITESIKAYTAAMPSVKRHIKVLIFKK